MFSLGLPFISQNVIFKCNLQAKTIVYSISNYRFCERIEREHKSNGVYFVFDLLQGVYYQKCYDPDCKFFRSADYYIPIDLNPFKVVQDTDDDDFTIFEEIPDELLLDAIQNGDGVWDLPD